MSPAVQHLNTRTTPNTLEPPMPISIRTTFTHETVLSVDPDTGAFTDTELDQARTVAQQAYREAYGMPEGTPLPDGALLWAQGPGEFVGTFTAKRQQT